MNPLNFLELFASLSLQVFFVVLLAHLLSRTTRNERVQCRLWQASYWVLLALTIVAVTLPHVRWTQARFEFNRQTVATIAEWETRFGHIALAIWSAGALCTFGIGLIRWVRLRLFLRSCRELDPQRSLDLLELLNRTPGSSDFGEVRFLTSDSLAGPFCTQFHHPYIVVPDYLLEFEPHELTHIIRHEMEHLQTGHPLQLFIQRIVDLLFWFHPTVWWASHQCALSREFVCDGAAIDSPDGIVCYLRTLLKVVEHASAAGPTHPLSFGRGKGSIARRAERLVECVQAERAVPRKPWTECRIMGLFTVAVMLAPMLWIPVNILASPRSHLSPWPRLTAQLLYDCGWRVRDYETYHHDNQLHELLENNDDGPPTDEETVRSARL